MINRILDSDYGRNKAGRAGTPLPAAARTECAPYHQEEVRPLKKIGVTQLKWIGGLRAGVMCVLLAFAPFVAQAAEARMEVMHIKSRVLQDNPLHDPYDRDVAIFLPSQAQTGLPLPVVYYLPGFGSSSKDFIDDYDNWTKFVQKVADEVTPVILVVVDGRTRWRGESVFESSAQGNYEDYVCDEVVAAVEAEHPAATNGVRRIIAGHSSGGFGALRLGSSRQKLFDAVIAMSPDSDFPTSHLPLVKIAAVSNAPLADIEKYETEELPPPKDGDLIYALALSAAYASQVSGQPDKFDWLYDANRNIRPEIWQRWLDNDPLTIVRKNPNAFGANQAVYLEGAAKDEFSANIGARKIYEVIRNRASRCTFYEPPGHHTDHLRERLQRGLAWVFERPLNEIK